MKTAFFNYLKRSMITAFSREETSPQAIANFVLQLARRPCSRANARDFYAWINDRRITQLAHFSTLSNVPHIARFGLIPREILELEVVYLTLYPYFPDSRRIDGLPEYNCLSISSPNYRMFTVKRANRGRSGWAVIYISPLCLTDFYFLFAPTNAASGCTTMDGVKGAERLFALPALRAELRLNDWEPTDPQAEALCDSIIPPDRILRIAVQTDEDKRWLGQYTELRIDVDETPFAPRRDWKYWAGRRITDHHEHAKSKL